MHVGGGVDVEEGAHLPPALGLVRVPLRALLGRLPLARVPVEEGRRGVLVAAGCCCCGGGGGGGGGGG